MTWNIWNIQALGFLDHDICDLAKRYSWKISKVFKKVNMKAMGHKIHHSIISILLNFFVSDSEDCLSLGILKHGSPLY